jgi:5-methylcytosine-specific restriction endonuclease McrA
MPSGLQVIDTHNVRIFNLTGGRTLPEWLPDRKRRKLLQRDVDLQVRCVCHLCRTPGARGALATGQSVV